MFPEWVFLTRCNTLRRYRYMKKAGIQRCRATNGSFEEAEVSFYRNFRHLLVQASGCADQTGLRRSDGVARIRQCESRLVQESNGVW